MKTFRQFIIESDKYTQVADGSSYGGGMSSADIDARKDLTADQKLKLKARRSRVSTQDTTSRSKPSSTSGTPPTGSPPKSSSIVPRKSSALSTNVKPPVQQIKTNMNVPGGASKLARGLRVAGRVAGPAAAALDVAAERSKGSGWLRSLAKGAVTAAGGAAGAAGGSVAGPVGTVAGGVGGAAAASKAFDTVAGKNAAERAADRLKNRQRQAGSEVKGIGGNTSFSQKKPGGPAFMSTGSGSQRKSVQLSKTGVVQRGGQSVAGNLAFKGGKAVYKAPDKPGTGTSNPLERIGRAVNPNAYKANDAKLAAQKLKTAQQNDAARNQKLGVKMKPGG
jgi:hypothetical protein